MFLPAPSVMPSPELPPVDRPRLFHVSEQANLGRFEPRFPPSPDSGVTTSVVWALHEERLVNFLVPRDCPRVTFYATPATLAEDRSAFFSSTANTAVVAIEHAWWEVALRTTLFLYEFAPTDFAPALPSAGYWTSSVPVEPIAVHAITRPLDLLVQRNAELRVVSELLTLRDRVARSSLAFSFLRMRHAGLGPTATLGKSPG